MVGLVRQHGKPARYAFYYPLATIRYYTPCRLSLYICGVVRIMTT